MRIALDAMGGDHAPGPIVAGAVKAVQANAGLRIVLVGDQAQIDPLLAAASSVRDRLEIFHCTQVVTMEESPVIALRKKPDNSISRCWQLLAEHKVEAIVSAGNTGAMVAGGFRLKLFLKYVRRPGIAAVLPTLKGPCVLLDVGANVNPKAEHLFQYGIMGAIFAKYILNCDQPKIGLLNIGTEEAKGHDLAKETHALFNNSKHKGDFIGNVEGRDINKGVCDVIVTDGFVGNVVLKLSEGVFEFVIKMVGKELMETLQNEKQLGQLAVQNLIKRYDYHEHGGALLLGIDGICIICHGSSSERAIENALGVAAKYIEAKLNDRIINDIASNPTMASEEQVAMPKTAFLFPGQGAQYVGMGKELCASLPAAQRLFDEAAAILGYNLLDVCANGPEDKLNSTAISQPAIYVASLAALEGLRAKEPALEADVVAAAGLSLGEYTALAFAGALRFADGLRLVQQRGAAMQAAADATPSGMVSVLGLPEDKVGELCVKASAAGSVQIANLLCPSNIVVSGTKAACDELERVAPHFGAMKTIRLAVAGAFHTAIMKPADEKLAAALAQCQIQAPRLPVWSNVDAQPHTDPAEVRSLLVRQVLQPVLWEKTMRNLLAAGVANFYEIGPGRVLAGLLKRVERKIPCVNIAA